MDLPPGNKICYSVLCDEPATVSLDYAASPDERYCYKHFDYFARESDRAVLDGAEDYRRGYEILAMRDIVPDSERRCDTSLCKNSAKVKIRRNNDPVVVTLCLACLDTISEGYSAGEFKARFGIKSIEKIGE